MKDLTTFIKSLKILFVEDDETTRNKFEKILTRIFNNVESSNNGLDGFLKYQENYSTNPYDLIISDIDMPKMSGLEMLEKIREKDNETLIIFITAKNDSLSLLKAIDLNVSGFINKPIDFDKLVKLIRQTSEKLHSKYLLDLSNQNVQKKVIQMEKMKEKYQNDIVSLRTKLQNLDQEFKKLQTSKTSNEQEDEDEKKIKILKMKNEEIQKMIKINKLLKAESEKYLAEKRELEDINIRNTQLLESYKNDLAKYKLQLLKKR